MNILTIDCDFAFNKIMPIINRKALQCKDFNQSMAELDIEVDRKFIFPTSCRVEYIKSIIDCNAVLNDIFIIVNHEDILMYIDLENDHVTNIDFHDDGEKAPKGICKNATCANWATFVKNYKWINKTDMSAVKRYDAIFICISPEWTPNLNFIFN